MIYIKALAMSLAILLLSACGGSSDSTEKNSDGAQNSNKDIRSDQKSTCTDSTEPVNWEKLLLADATTLSEYNLFSNTCDPSKTNSAQALPYDLPVMLFTDYASKYRFVFIPEGKSATFDATEALEFPTGTVITKTFAMPADTTKRGLENEGLIETRLLIKREIGWIARNYVWNLSGTEAYRSRTGGPVLIKDLKHGDDNLAFTYAVPSEQQCLTCHQYKPEGSKKTDFRPLGPKARFLNSDYDYGQGPKNQLIKWFEEGMLTGLPDISNVQKATPFNDDMLPSEYNGTQELLTATAKSWLDINCGHCHRPEGQASNTAFRADFNIPWVGFEAEHGACQVPVSGAAEGSTKIIVPGNADTSLLYNRMHTTTPGLSMPSLGRAVIHVEGSALIKAWINSLSKPTCQ